MALSLRGAHVPPDIMLMGVRWSLASPLRSRPVAGLLEERGVPSDHAPLQRGGVHDRPQRAEAFHRRQRPVWGSGRLDETESNQWC